jgi:hypothetical protein
VPGSTQRALGRLCGGREVGWLLWYHGRPRSTQPASRARQDLPGAAQGQTLIEARGSTYDGERRAKGWAVDRGAGDE